MANRVVCLCLFLAVLSHVESANILGMFTMYSPSHNIIHIAAVRALADAGHNVTVVTMLPLNDKNPNYNVVYLPPREDDQKRLRDLFHGMASSESKLKRWRYTFSALDIMNDVQQKIVTEPVFKDLMNKEVNHFDLMLFGYGFNDYHFGIADHFDCPVIVSHVNVPSGPVNAFVGNPEGFSYIPILWLGTKPMGFWKRVANFIIAPLISVIMLRSDQMSEKYHKKNFPPELGYRSMDEMRKNVSLVFCSTFFSEGPIRPVTPNFIEIGGIQIKEKPDPFPKDIEEFLGTAEDGIIFFSLGSNVKSTDFSKTASQAIFNVLSQRKEKVLWKWEDEQGPGQAPNILFRKWCPQDDILAHPKTKLFITHGGKGSIVEAQYHGVPMLALPVFGDQPMNANLMEAEGYGLVLDYHHMTEEQFRQQLEEILNNSTYAESVKKYSTLYRDRPLSARQSVVYWTEYVIRHHGAPHLQSPRVHLNFWQYNSLDVVAVLLVVLFATFYVSKAILKYFVKSLRRLCGCNLKIKRE